MKGRWHDHPGNPLTNQRSNPASTRPGLARPTHGESVRRTDAQNAALAKEAFIVINTFMIIMTLRPVAAARLSLADRSGARSTCCSCLQLAEWRAVLFPITQSSLGSPASPLAYSFELSGVQ